MSGCGHTMDRNAHSQSRREGRTATLAQAVAVLTFNGGYVREYQPVSCSLHSNRVRGQSPTVPFDHRTGTGRW